MNIRTKIMLFVFAIVLTSIPVVNAYAAPSPVGRPVPKVMTLAVLKGEVVSALKLSIDQGAKSYKLGKCSLVSRIQGTCHISITGLRDSKLVTCTGFMDVRIYQKHFQYRLRNNVCK